MPSGSESSVRKAVPATPGSHLRDSRFVSPGDVYVGDAETRISTVVGSCIAVCLRDTSGIVGGMAHFLLPQGSLKTDTQFRYANHAIPHLIEQVRRRVPATAPLEAKIVGGASVLSSFKGSRRRLGLSNIEAARLHLLGAEIAVQVEVVGGDVGRKVIYEVHDGSMWVQELKGQPVGE